MEAEVSWRRVSAEERFVMDVARSRRRRAVEVSISSRSGSVRFVWWWDGVEMEWEDVSDSLGWRRGWAVVVR